MKSALEYLNESFSINESKDDKELQYILTKGPMQPHFLKGLSDENKYYYAWTSVRYADDLVNELKRNNITNYKLKNVKVNKRKVVELTIT